MFVFSFCINPAEPVSCAETKACIETPVAPTGGSFAVRPPDRLTGRLQTLNTVASKIAS